MVDLEELKAKLSDLPAVPVVVTQVAAMVNDPAADVEQLARIIEKDPGLSARILRISNSPYYGMRQAVGSIELALVVLGMREVRNVVVGVTLLDCVKPPRVGDRTLEIWIRHAFDTASAGKRICQALDIAADGEAFMVGLLHDVGKMAMARAFKDEYLDVYVETKGHGEDLCVAEIATFGFTHAQLASSLAKKWSLPLSLSSSIAMHHQPSHELSNTPDPRLAAILKLANWASRSDGSDAEEWAALDEWTHVTHADNMAARVNILHKIVEDRSLGNAVPFGD